MEVENRQVERCPNDPTHLMVWRCQECEVTHPVCPHCAAVGAEREREEFVKLATQALSLDRTPHPPTGGMQTGDMLVVGMRDWYKLLRLARWIVRARGEGDGDG